MASPDYRHDEVLEGHASHAKLCTMMPFPNDCIIAATRNGAIRVIMSGVPQDLQAASPAFVDLSRQPFQGSLMTNTDCAQAGRAYKGRSVD